MDALAYGAQGAVYVKNNKVYKRFSTNGDVTVGNIRELMFYKILDHPNIVKLLEHNKKWLVLEYGGKPLSYRKFTIAEIKNIGGQILSALSYMHNMRIIHCDIKPDNILIDMFGQVRICDFNTSNLGMCKITMPLFTVKYRPPEAYNSHVDTYSDIWALGCTLWELYHGEPFATGKLDRTEIKPILTKYMEGADAGYVDFIRVLSGMIIYHGPLRKTANELLKDSFFNSPNYVPNEAKVFHKCNSKLIRGYYKNGFINKEMTNFANGLCGKNDNIDRQVACLYVASYMNDTSQLETPHKNIGYNIMKLINESPLCICI